MVIHSGPYKRFVGIGKGRKIGELQRMIEEKKFCIARKIPSTNDNLGMYIKRKKEITYRDVHIRKLGMETGMIRIIPNCRKW